MGPDVCFLAMGIYERDYMREAPSPQGGRQAGPVVARIAVILFSAVLVVACFRMPLPLYVKLPVLIGLGFGIRYLWSVPRSMEGTSYLRKGALAERARDHARAAYFYELALRRLPGDSTVLLRLLSAYHFSDRVHKARELIRKIDGKVFRERELEELEFLLSKYGSVSLERAGSGSRVRLG